MYLDGLLHADRESEAIEFIQLDATAQTMPFEDHFDLIGAFDVIEHIDDDDSVLENVFRMLNKKGKFIFKII